MPWERRRYRTNKVWVEVDARGEAVLDDRGLASMRYKPQDDRTYTVRPEDFGALEAEPEDGAAGAGEAEAAGITIAAAGVADGAPGPAGLGIVLRWRDHGREIQRFLGEATPERARLEAVLAALRAVTRPTLPVTLRTDALPAPDEPAAADADLREEIRTEAARFAALRWIPVAGEERAGDGARAARLARDTIPPPA